MESAQPANVELVRRLFEAFEVRDLDAMIDLTGPEFEFFPQVTASMVKRVGAVPGP